MQFSNDDLARLAVRFSKNEAEIGAFFETEMPQATPFERAKRMLNVGWGFHKNGFPKVSIGINERALVIFRKLKNRVETANALHNLAMSYKSIGDKRRALDLYRQTLKIDRETGREADCASTFSNMGLLFDDMGLYKKAIEHFNRAIEIDRRFGNRLDEGRTWNNMGMALVGMGRPDEALKSYGRALDIYGEADERSGERAKTFLNLGNAWFRKGFLEKAEALFHEAETIWRADGQRIWLARALNGLGRIRQERGEFREAISFLNEAASIYEKHDHPQEAARSFGAVGDAWLSVGDAKKGLLFHQKALETASKVQSLMGEMAAMSGMATAFATLGDGSKALLFRQKAYQKALQTGSQSHAATAALNLGWHFLTVEKQPKAARVFLEKARELNAVSERNQGFEAEANLLLGLVHQQKGDWPAAKTCFEKSLRLARLLKKRPSEQAATGAISEWHIHQGHLRGAEFWAKKTIRLAENQFENLWHEPLLVAWQGQLARAYRNLITLRLENGKLREAFDLAQRAKARAQVKLLARLARPSGGGRSAAEMELFEKEADLFERLLSARRAESVGLENEADWNAASAELADLHQKMAAFDPLFVQMRRGDPMDFEAVKARL